MGEEEQRLSKYVEQVTGAKVVSIDRQSRWRPAWFIEAELDGQPLSLYARGDKGLDAEVYPGLDREAGIIKLFEAGGLPVAHVYGICPDPRAIVMTGIPGVREMHKAKDDAERQGVAEQYIEAMAKMHALDIAPFVAMGVDLPPTPEGVAMSYLNENKRLYRRVKAKPEPLLEFALRWVARNVPPRQVKPAVLHGDPGQFHYQDGKLTGLYDFEAVHIGDPMMDVASLRMRHPFEPLGADPMHMIRHYAKVTGKPIDPAELKWHTTVFAVTPGMAMAGMMAKPEDANMQAEYLFWDIITKRALVWSLAECLGVTLEKFVAPQGPPDRNRRVSQVLQQTLARLKRKDGEGEDQRHGAVMMALWLEQLVQKGGWADAQNLNEAGEILGKRPADWVEADAEMEKFVLSAGPEYDERLIRYFGRQVERDLALMGPFGARAEGYALPLVDL